MSADRNLAMGSAYDEIVVMATMAYVSVHTFLFCFHSLKARMSSSSDISSALDSYTLEELQQMLTDPQLGTQMANKIEAEVLTRLATKSQNGSPIGILVTPSKQQKMSEQIGQAEKFLSKCTTLVNQMNQETMRVKEDIIKPLQETINSAKKRPPSAKTKIYVDSDEKRESEEIDRKPASKPKSKKDNNFSKDNIPGYRRNEYEHITKHNRKPASKPKSKKDNNFSKDDSPGYRRNGYENITKHNRKPASKPKSKKDNNFSKDDISGYERNEYQNFTKHRFHHLTAGVAIRNIAETHADVVTADTGLDHFMTKFPNMKKLNIDLCGLITSQPGEGTFKHDPHKNAIAVFLVKGRVQRYHYHYVLVNAIQSLVLFMYHWDGKYFGRNVLDAALEKQYDDVIRLMEPYIVLHERRLHIYFRFDDHVINNDIIKEINDFNLQLKYYTDGFRCNTEFFPQYVGICRGEF
eukprot:jgi/Psemu1/46942/gm1.46942_g